MKLKNLSFANQTLGTHKGNVQVDKNGVLETDDQDIIKLFLGQNWTVVEAPAPAANEIFESESEPETPAPAPVSKSRSDRRK